MASRFSKQEIEPPRSILVLKPSSFGDIIHCLPAVARLKSAWPTTRITWLTNPEWAPLLTGNADLDAVVTFPRRQFRGWLGWWKFWRWQKERVRGLRPDLALDFQGLLRTALIGRLSKARTFYGLSDAREGAGWLYDHSAPVPMGVPHAVERYLALADFAVDRFGREYDVPLTQPSGFKLPSGQSLDTQDGARLETNFVVLHPFARGHGKSLSVLQVEEFCRLLAPRQVVLVGRKSEDTLRLQANSLDLLDHTTLLQLIWTIRRASFVVSVDSGPAHLAAALERPLVAIHTWSDPRRVGPYRSDAWVWKNGKLLEVKNLPSVESIFFRAKPPALSSSSIQTICELVTSFSNSCA